MPSVDPIELERWRRGETEPGLAVRIVCGVWYNHIPQLLGWTPSLPGSIFGLIRLFALWFLALWPIWIKFYDNSSPFTWQQAFVLSGCIIGALVYNFVYDKITKSRKERTTKKRLLRKLTNELRGTIAGFGPAIQMKGARQTTKITETRHSVLNCIADAARIYLSDYEGVCVEVALLLFDDHECKRIKIVDRTTRARDTGRILDSENVMAFHVAKSGGRHRVTHDFLRDHPFPKTSLSTPDLPPYRSILFIPLLDKASGRPDTCIGVVTVDSTRPYHFWPGNGEDLVHKLQPYCAWLTLLINLGEPHRLRYES